MRSFFPTCRGSGIVVTCRELKFASISSHKFRMDLLVEHKSWDLFCKHVFGQDSCPNELGSIAKKIAHKCRGLPLSIAVIGSHLAKSPRNSEYWESIANNISSVDDDRCLKIVSLSYTHLPVHLKPCFLYFAIFSEDDKIDASRLLRLWVAEGFVKPIKGKSLEDAARDYLNDLVDINLILASRSSRWGRIIRCKIHDLLRDFYLNEASRKNFICTVQKLEDLKVTNNERRIVVHPSSLNELRNRQSDISTVLKARVLLRSLIFYGELPSIENKLLRVLANSNDRDFLRININRTTFRELVNMRYFEFSIYDGYKLHKIPSSISLLWNLQSLIIINHNMTAPPEIWKMPQLRHIYFPYAILPHPPRKESNGALMENLQSVKIVMNFCFCEEIVKRIPNIKKLYVHYDDEYEGFEEGFRTLNTVDHLQKLKSFSCTIDRGSAEQSYRMLQIRSFPHSLKKLQLKILHWDDVATKIGSLPLLEVLELNSCIGSEWKLVEGQFAKLKDLELFRCDSLRYLTANNNYFPCLQLLLLYKLDSLEGISSEIGDITTLKSIGMYQCPDSAVISAKDIADEQYDLRN